MGPHDVQLVRVYTRDPASPTISDDTFASGAPFEVVVEAEAGVTIHGTPGTPYNVQIVVRDLTDNTIIVPLGAPGSFDNGFLAAGGWVARAYSRAFTIPAQPAAKEGHVYQAIAYANVGMTPDVSFATSPLFMIHRP
jgi:hypothetical protein